MPSRRQLSLCSALIAVLLGLALFAGSALAAAQPIDSQENSVQSSVDGFVSYLKSETNDALMAAARIARENKDTIDEAKARIGVQIDAVSAALSSRKERLKTFGNDASAMWEEMERDGRFVMGQDRAAGSRRSGLDRRLDTDPFALGSASRNPCLNPCPKSEAKHAKR